MFDWTIFSDHELVMLHADAVEMQNGNWIKEIKAEINRRWRVE